ncbi:MAG: DJ-1/PfpI family protein [Ardenticatenaceae bacterium]|nr:DJ-1/PfpI family protein [Ardenticatenaceae bacterium]MCB9443256.1 DJ-1/PfpI family protein [Ardenticatenaceae bacterium]
MEGSKLAAPDVLILIASHFDEKAVVYCLSELRQQGLAVALVSVTSGMVQSVRGLTLRPDKSLAETDELITAKRQLLLLAGGAACAAAVLSDPRSHQLIQRILQTDGYVAAMSQTYALALETGLDVSDRFLRQGGMETAVFVRQLINHISTHVTTG